MSRHWSEHREGGGALPCVIFTSASNAAAFAGACCCIRSPCISSCAAFCGSSRLDVYLERVFGKPARRGWSCAISMLCRDDPRSDLSAHRALAQIRCPRIRPRRVARAMLPDRGMLLLGAHVAVSSIARALLQRPDGDRARCAQHAADAGDDRTLHALNPAMAKNVSRCSRPGTKWSFALPTPCMKQSGDPAW